MDCALSRVKSGRVYGKYSAQYCIGKSRIAIQVRIPGGVRDRRPERAHPMSSVTLLSVDRKGRELDAVRDLLLEYGEALAFNACFGGLDEELLALHRFYRPPRGILLLARQGVDDAGCVAVRGIDASTCELKRLYVRPRFRRAGLGRALVLQAIERSRAAGYERVCLDTLPVMIEARALYASLGFTPCAPYYDNSCVGSDCFALRLAP